jgi:hypothetical protein
MPASEAINPMKLPDKEVSFEKITKNIEKDCTSPSLADTPKS